MKVDRLQIVGIRCFDDTGELELSPHCNIFVGQNNVGKSTILKAILGYQSSPFVAEDARTGAGRSFTKIQLSGVKPDDVFAQRGRIPRPQFATAVEILRGNPPDLTDATSNQAYRLQMGQPLFQWSRPHHKIVPFLARRKTQAFDQNVNLSVQNSVVGTLHNLYSRIDLVAPVGHPDHEAFQAALRDVIGLPITTRASASGKEAGFYLDRDTFVTLDRMGDGVAEMVALVVELCVERGKIFLLEEPETNLHPKGLKALLSMIRAASEHNQFMIATHSNIVVRELGHDDRSKVFRVYHESDGPTSSSGIELVPRNPVSHTELLRELGYEFSDVGLYEAWLFLEESSAEQVVNEVLVPYLVPDLKGRLRTYSAGGISNVEPGVAEFQRLVVFVHLQPAYEGRLWVRVDAGEEGVAVVQTLRKKFQYLTEEFCDTFSASEFERYYPLQFQERVAKVLAIGSRKDKQAEKVRLLEDVLVWSRSNPDEAQAAWSESAAEPIDLLRRIAKSLRGG